MYLSRDEIIDFRFLPYGCLFMMALERSSPGYEVLV